MVLLILTKYISFWLLNFASMVQISDENFKPFWNMRLGEWQKYNPPSPSLFKDGGIKNIGHSMSIRNLVFGVNSVTVSYLIRCNSLLQIVTDVITKCDSYFITKCDRSLLQNAAFLLQNATVLRKCSDFITKCHTYYKMQLLLQIMTVYLKLMVLLNI